MKGWKTKFGAILMAMAGVVPVVVPTELTDTVTNVLYGLGMAFGVIGVGHKIEKQGKL